MTTNPASRRTSPSRRPTRWSMATAVACVTAVAYGAAGCGFVAPTGHAPDAVLTAAGPTDASPSPASLPSTASATSTAPTSAPTSVATSGPATAAASLFDPARHMRVAEVRPGMTGYGLSVFQGTKVERFEVTVRSVLKNFNPRRDVVLIDCRGANLEHTGAIAGMSGSPIYLTDDAGRSRMIGAFAYGWPEAKDPIAGVQPIEYMLDLPVAGDGGKGDGANPPAGAATKPAAVSSRGTGVPPVFGPTRTATFGASAPLGRPTWHWSDAQAAAANLFVPPADTGGTGTARGTGSSPALRPLSAPLMATGGISPAVARCLAPALAARGLTLLQAGGGGGSPGPAAGPALPLAPGGVLAVPLLTGDVELAAVGTVTEVLGDRVFGFGHPFNNEGAVALPLAGGEVQGVVANLTTSFKLGAAGPPVGTLRADGAVGVGGTLGAVPATIPITVDVRDADTGRAETYHFKAAVHPKFTPMLVGTALASAAGGASELPQYNTTDYTVDLRFANGRTLTLADRDVNVTSAALMQLAAAPVMAAAENPFERVPLAGVTATITVSRQVRDATIVRVTVPTAVRKPGDAVTAFVVYRPFRGDEAVLPVEMDLPTDLKPGVYRFVVGDADRYLADEMASRPFRYTAQSADEVFDVAAEASGVRGNALYLRLVRQQDGVAVGRTALPLLPSGLRKVLVESGRSDTTAFTGSAVKVVPTERVFSGSAEFALTVQAASKVEGAGGRVEGAKPAPGTGANANPAPGEAVAPP